MSCLLFLAANKLNAENGNLPEGKEKIKLEHDGSILDVDEDDIEKVGVPCNAYNWLHYNLRLPYYILFKLLLYRFSKLGHVPKLGSTRYLHH